MVQSNVLRFLALMLMAPGAVRACSCVAIGNCGMNLKPGGVVFLGKVISKIEVPQTETLGDIAGMFQGYAVHLSTTENFQGAGPPDQEIVVYTGQGGGDCGYPFVIGNSYLVYASSFNNRLSTGICSGTGPQEMVGGVLKELRAIRDGGHADDLFGTIGIAAVGVGSEDLVNTRPLSKVSIHAIGNRGIAFSTVTDEQGAYAFSSLPDDTYRIEQDLPKGLSTWQSLAGKSVTVEVLHRDGAGAGCEVDVFARPDGEISGRVIDAGGNGVPGFVTIEPADPKEAQAAVHRGGLPGCETEDGTFTLPQLPPGRYRLTFSPSIGGRLYLQTKYYWPPANNISHAGAMELGFGQHIDDVRFELSTNR